MYRLRHLSWLILFAIAAALPAAAKDLAVVVNKSNEAKSITAADLAKMLKAGTRKWPGGQDIVIVLHDPNSPAMKVTAQKLLGITPDQLKAIIAANKGMFVVADNDDVTLKMVAGNGGAVGLVDVYAINSSVNVLRIDGKMPLEPGYALHGVW